MICQVLPRPTLIQLLQSLLQLGWTGGSIRDLVVRHAFVPVALTVPDPGSKRYGDGGVPLPPEPARFEHPVTVRTRLPAVFTQDQMQLGQLVHSSMLLQELADQPDQITPLHPEGPRCVAPVTTMSGQHMLQEPRLELGHRLVEWPALSHGESPVECRCTSESSEQPASSPALRRCCTSHTCSRSCDQ